MDEPQKHNAKWKARQTRSHIAQLHLHEISKICESIETESRLVIARGCRMVVMGTNCLPDTQDFTLRWWKCYWNWTKVMEAQHCEYTKCHWIVKFKVVSFMLCEFRLHQKSKITLEIVRIMVAFWESSDWYRTCEGASRVLVTFYFLIWVLVTRVCLLCENYWV